MTTERARADASQHGHGHCLMCGRENPLYRVAAALLLGRRAMARAEATFMRLPGQSERRCP